MTNITPPMDRRGKHSIRPNKIPHNVVQQIIYHIQSFPVRSSYYSRNSTKNKYILNPDLNVNKMYHFCLDTYEPEAFLGIRSKNHSFKTLIGYEFYLHVFNTTFNYSFGYPRLYTCEKCDTLKLKLWKETDEDIIRVLEVEKNIHLRKTQTFYDNLKNVTEMAKK